LRRLRFLEVGLRRDDGAQPLDRPESRDEENQSVEGDEPEQKRSAWFVVHAAALRRRREIQLRVRVVVRDRLARRYHLVLVGEVQDIAAMECGTARDEDGEHAADDSDDFLRVPETAPCAKEDVHQNGALRDRAAPKTFCKQLGVGRRRDPEIRMVLH
jgi:hypothetical protein